MQKHKIMSTMMKKLKKMKKNLLIQKIVQMKRKNKTIKNKYRL